MCVPSVLFLAWFDVAYSLEAIVEHLDLPHLRNSIGYVQTFRVGKSVAGYMYKVGIR
jgi:hypothetical protein